MPDVNALWMQQAAGGALIGALPWFGTFQKRQGWKMRSAVAPPLASFVRLGSPGRHDPMRRPMPPACAGFAASRCQTERKEGGQGEGGKEDGNFDLPSFPRLDLRFPGRPAVRGRGKPGHLSLSFYYGVSFVARAELLLRLRHGLHRGHIVVSISRSSVWAKKEAPCLLPQTRSGVPSCLRGTLPVSSTSESNRPSVRRLPLLSLRLHSRMGRGHAVGHVPALQSPSKQPLSKESHWIDNSQ